MTKPSKTPRTPEVSTIAVLDRAVTFLNVGLTELELELDKLINGKAAKSKHDKASRIAYLLGKVGPIADTVRKIEAARAKRLEEITAADVLAFLRQLKPRDRAGLLAEVQAIDAGGSGLA